ncbi:histone lysine methyltransferase Set2 [Schizosaccharomyces japonicus yFS275]|uniref:Histone-lysine N-methyltransferase, H3 lysine-36 specific n=1 Tax=Schizosaccharomyces japonicus (strain yFS275 / FY16936) TaxID=402676 RepID=B6K1E8_SCHJY|nr:histone lysine methyltransferase Set2 [Schizosaccharomyces japonicus yFS275]EEB07769.2 histone lysine methyltransferase Set2 [Schizosaccharomyces japonicus yFS275]
MSDVVSSSSSTTTEKKRRSRSSSSKVERPVALFNHLPSAVHEAKQAFEEIDSCLYANAHLGEPQQNEAMACDCKPEWVDGVNIACGHGSYCINRMTSIECTDENCYCGPSCQNQRFQKKMYADVDVIQTEKKGFGLRANSYLTKGTFVYEYIGEVIPEVRFRKRMREYDERGIRHFYFMMLQKGEYIDATVKGSLARFCNHSCRPNCYVDKWVVGNKLRMGIFCKRDIQKGEELTFDYNVDRYGAQAQPCYCGEDCCLGYIGGRTQTEAQPKLAENVREALGLESEEEDWETASARHHRRKKGEDESAEVINSVQATALDANDVRKVMSVLMQTKDEVLIRKLLERLHLTIDPVVCRQVISMHGYNIVGSILKNFSTDPEIIKSCLEIMKGWPSLTRNKIHDSKVDTIVEQFVSSEDEIIKTLAQDLLQVWSTLELAYRIPRRKRDPESKQSTEEEKANTPVPDVFTNDENSNVSWGSNENESKMEEHHTSHVSEHQSNSWHHSKSDHAGGWKRFNSPRPRRDHDHHSFKKPEEVASEVSETSTQASTKQDLQSIINKALESVQQKTVVKSQQAEEERKRQEMERIKRKQAYEEARKRHEMSKKERQSSENHTSKPISSNDPKALKFKAVLARFFANKTARYQDSLGKPEFKSRVKKMTEIVLTKHLKLVASRQEPELPQELSQSQQAKLKAWSLQYMEKVYLRLKDHNSSGTSAMSTPTDVSKRPLAEGETNVPHKKIKSPI